MNYLIQKNKYLLLTICIAVPLTFGALAGFATADAIGPWYNQLNKPFFNPPNAVFGPVWSLLYILMGISTYLVLQTSRHNEQKKVIAIFSVQMILNFLWSFLFFHFQNPRAAFIEIILLWIAIVVMIKIYKSINRTAALLQIPYLLWVSFASILNASIWHLN